MLKNRPLKRTSDATVHMLYTCECGSGLWIDKGEDSEVCKCGRVYYGLASNGNILPVEVKGLVEVIMERFDDVEV